MSGHDIALALVSFVLGVLVMGAVSVALVWYSDEQRLRDNEEEVGQP